MKMTMMQQQSGNQETLPDLRQDQVMMCLTNALSSDSQFTQRGDYRYKEEMTYGCYHNLRKPASD